MRKLFSKFQIEEREPLQNLEKIASEILKGQVTISKWVHIYGT